MDKGTFTLKSDYTAPTNTTMYECKHCVESETPHKIEDRSAGQTEVDSHWGQGVPTTKRFCSGCGRWDGPWVSADIVGGGW